MPHTHLLYKKQVDVNDKIHIVIPSVGDIIDREDEYYSMISAITSMPIDMMAQLHEAGID